MLSEKQVQKKVIDYVRKNHRYFDMRTPGGTPGVLDGSPDYIIWANGGRCIMIEFKTQLKKSPTFQPLQQQQILRLRQAGHLAFATSNPEFAIKVIESNEYDSKIINSDQVFITEMEK
jgi:hypothetical protein